MNWDTLIITIISSSLIATILSSIFNIYLKNMDFKNEYYKSIINKRLLAYEWLEKQIALLKTSVIDENDEKIYHIIFSYGEKEFLKFSQNSLLANAYSLWIDEDTNKILNDLIFIFNQINFEFDVNNKSELISAGKKYYSEIAKLRDELETSVKNDLLRLYKFDKIKKKKKIAGNQKIKLYKRNA